MENNIDSKALAIEIAKILDQKKAQDVRVLKVESLTVLTDYFVIASGTSTTQVGSLADEVEFALSQKGIEPISTEGFDSKNWVLLDYSNVIVHVFVPNTRTYYDLEHPVGRRRAHRHLGVSDAGSQPVREHIPARCFFGMPSQPCFRNDGEVVSRNTGQ